MLFLLSFTSAKCKLWKWSGPAKKMRGWIWCGCVRAGGRLFFDWNSKYRKIILWNFYQKATKKNCYAYSTHNASDLITISFAHTHTHRISLYRFSSVLHIISYVFSSLFKKFEVLLSFAIAYQIFFWVVFFSSIGVFARSGYLSVYRNPWHL